MNNEKNNWYRVDAYDVYQFIVKYEQKYLYPPTIYEMAGACNCSFTTIKKRLKKLEKMGLIITKRGNGRAITLLDYELTKK